MNACVIEDTGHYCMGYSREQLHRKIADCPKGMVTHHTCNNKLCVNPEHLKVITQSEHVKLHDPNQNRDKTHCKQGHEFTDENTYTTITAHGLGRQCRTCSRKWKAAYKARQRRS